MDETLDDHHDNHNYYQQTDDSHDLNEWNNEKEEENNEKKKGKMKSWMEFLVLSPSLFCYLKINIIQYSWQLIPDLDLFLLIPKGESAICMDHLMAEEKKDFQGYPHDSWWWWWCRWGSSPPHIPPSHSFDPSNFHWFTSNCFSPLIFAVKTKR